MTRTRTVSPAAGLRLSEETSTVRAPEGDWERAEPLVDFASAVHGPGRFDSIQLADRPSLAGNSTLNSLARSALSLQPDDVKTKRRPNVDLEGTPAYVLRYPDPDFPAVNYDIVALHNGHSVAVNITLDKKTLRRNPQLLKSVLASFRWKD